MRASVVVLLLSAGAIACGGTSVGVGGDGGPEGNPCEGLGCANEGPSVTFHVTDGTTNGPVANLTFREYGQPLTGSCAGQTDSGTCTAFRIFFQAGHHVVSVEGEGYIPQNETFDLTAPTGCCGIG